MKRSVLPRALGLASITALANWPVTAAACTACMGDVNSKTAPAINAAIFLMLGCIGFMLASLAGFGIYLMKRANAPLPPHAELAQMIPSQEFSK
jgi:hypothetical protein